jgi:hypothetical protein
VGKVGVQECNIFLVWGNLDMKGIVIGVEESSCEDSDVSVKDVKFVNINGGAVGGGGGFESVQYFKGVYGTEHLRVELEEQEDEE